MSRVKDGGACAQMHAMGKDMLSVDLHDLHAFSSDLYRKLITYPSEVMTLMDSAAKVVLGDIAGVPAETADVQVSRHGGPWLDASTLQVRELHTLRQCANSVCFPCAL